MDSRVPSHWRMEGRGSRVSQSFANGLLLGLLFISDRTQFELGSRKAILKGLLDTLVEKVRGRTDQY